MIFLDLSELLVGIFRFFVFGFFIYHMKKLFMHYILPSLMDAFKSELGVRKNLVQQRDDAFSNQEENNRLHKEQQLHLEQFQLRLTQWHQKTNARRSSDIKKKALLDQQVTQMQHAQYVQHMGGAQRQKILQQIYNQILIVLHREMEVDGEKQLSKLLSHIVSNPSSELRH